MNTRIRYTDEPVGDLKVVKDFLPPPEDLVLRDDKVKVTISLSRSSVDFFKSMARKRHTSYQKMIRRLLDAYSAQYQEHQ
jgi:predicted DNA binding CopG/RHH family protein